MTAPLVLLAVLSVVGGYSRAYPRAFGGVFNLIPEAAGATHAVVLGTSLVVLVLGAGAALAFYTTDGRTRFAARVPAVFGFLSGL